MKMLDFIRNVITAVILFICLIVVTAILLLLVVYRRLRLIPRCLWRINAVLAHALVRILDDGEARGEKRVVNKIHR